MGEVEFKHPLAEGIYLAAEGVVPADDLGRVFETPDTGEE